MPIRRILLIVFVVCLWAIPKAEASPILTTWSGLFSQGPLAGTSFDFTFVFDALPFDPVADPFNVFPCCGAGTSKILYAAVSVAGTQIYSALNPVGGFWHVAPGVGVFGPMGFQVPVHALPAGLTSWGVGMDPITYYTYAGSPPPPGAIDNVREGPLVRLPAGSVPEPTSLLFALGGIGAFAIFQRSRKRSARIASR